MPIIEWIKGCFTRPPTPAEHFQLASNDFESALAEVESYTISANDRYDILAAGRHLKAAGDQEAAFAAYEETIAAFSDPADFQSYTADYLNAHSAAMDVVARTFDHLTAALGTINREDDLYEMANQVYRATARVYFLAADAYVKAAHCAMTTALEASLQSKKNEFELMILKARASNTQSSHLAAEATPLKQVTEESAAAARSLEKAATNAETIARKFRMSARAAEHNL